MFKPNIQQMTTPVRVQSRIETDVNGQLDISYVDLDPAMHFCNFKPNYGTEAIQAGAIEVQDGGTLTMWFHPDISERSRVLLNNDETKAYDVISAENIEMRNQFLILKVSRAVNA